VARKTWKDVDAGSRRRAHRLPGALDVLRLAARQCRHRRALDLGRHRPHCREVALGGDREAGLDDVHAEQAEGARHLELLAEVHAAPRRLLAVTQRGVEDDQPIGGGLGLHICLPPAFSRVRCLPADKNKKPPRLSSRGLASTAVEPFA
jgi:hypothetical protein